MRTAAGLLRPTRLVRRGQTCTSCRAARLAALVRGGGGGAAGVALGRQARQRQALRGDLGAQPLRRGAQLRHLLRLRPTAIGSGLRAPARRPAELRRLLRLRLIATGAGVRAPAHQPAELRRLLRSVADKPSTGGRNFSLAPPPPAAPRSGQTQGRGWGTQLDDCIACCAPQQPAHMVAHRGQAARRAQPLSKTWLIHCLGSTSTALTVTQSRMLSSR